MSYFPTKEALFLLFVAVFLSITTNGAYHQAVKNAEVHASKGRFMVHMLHSAYFYRNTVNVKWSATARGKPELPFWLHLFPSRHRGIAYLVGTPVTPLNQVVIHVIALSLDTYERAEQYVTIMLSEDVRYNSSTHQIVEIRVKNVEAEEFMNPHGNQLKRLEHAIHKTFSRVNPYVYNILPEFMPEPNQDGHDPYRPQIKAGSIIQIGTQQRFHQNVAGLAVGLQNNPTYCSQNSIIPLNKHFHPGFDVDWCQFSVRNVTQLKSSFLPISYAQQPSKYGNSHTKAAKIEQQLNEKDDESGVLDFSKTSQQHKKPLVPVPVVDKDERTYNFPHPYYFWESVLIFPLLAVFCIFLVLILSIIFFGRREGQQWRDYKTPKEQLHEYLNVRESQRQLRELSVQRQVLLSPNRSKLGTPLGVQDFLRSRDNSPAMKKRNAINDSQSRLTHPPTPTIAERRANSTMFDDGQERFPLLNTRSSVGKQTVAQAALETGSSLNLYRNPLDNEDYLEEKRPY